MAYKFGESSAQSSYATLRHAFVKQVCSLSVRDDHNDAKQSHVAEVCACGRLRIGCVRGDRTQP
ncbi:MAG: hypothetical protein WAO08_33110, partial [Hyphomicrobiaceae bacterium]